MIKLAIIGVVCVFAYFFYKEGKKYLGIADAQEGEFDAELESQEVRIRTRTAMRKKETRTAKEELNKEEETDVREED